MNTPPRKPAGRRKATRDWSGLTSLDNSTAEKFPINTHTRKIFEDRNEDEGENDQRRRVAMRGIHRANENFRPPIFHLRSRGCWAVVEMSPAQESPPEMTVTLIDELLAEQRSLTAVSRFARKHESHSLPFQARYYRDLIPLTQPRPGEQYAFEVDLDQCSGCKGCVTACHALNGLDEDESWRSVGLLVGGVNGHAMQQTVTTACHHCVDPGCLNGCPVLAYDKDPVTGIVRHLDDQCIGCQYCVMKCPYDIPKYSTRLGIVRKCDLCHQRLAVGEAPACVQACPNEAIKIRLVEQNSVIASYRGAINSDNPFLAATPAPDYTSPTTLYKSRRSLISSLRAADEATLKPQHAHWPLVFLLVLSQASVGLVGAAWLATLTYRRAPSVGLTVYGCVAMAAALGIATLHLGRPHKAWRAFLGWRTSWFSREVIALGAYLGAVATTAGLALLKFESLTSITQPFALLLGFASVFCSVMLYVDTRREFWSEFHTGIRFAGTTLLTGLAAWLVSESSIHAPVRWTLVALPMLTLMKLVLEAAPLRHGNLREWTPLKRTARLLTGPLRVSFAFRIASATAGGILLPMMITLRWLPQSGLAASLVLALLLVGELAERYLFFTAVSPVQMPGGQAR